MSQLHFASYPLDSSQPNPLALEEEPLPALQNDLTASGLPKENNGAAWIESEQETALRLCLRRIHSWRLPPHWSLADWWEEVDAQVHADGWKAVQDFDPARGVPVAGFTYSRVMAGMLTRYRQEWRYGLHNFPDRVDPEESEDTNPSQSCASHDLVEWALLQLSDTDNSFIKKVFWGQSTESQLADQSGMTQQAVNKRKRKILRALRKHLSSAGE